MIIVPNLLNTETLKQFRIWLDEVKWQDGKATAGPFAASVKNNLQASPDEDGRISQMQQIIAHKLVNDPLIKAYARPKAIIEILFSKYETGHEYGLHVDNSMMHETRVDLAFTLFLSEGCSGGRLVIDDGVIGDQIDNGFKLEPGSIVIYPANTLHRVEQVTFGTRLAAVGWIRSYIRDAEKRELLFELAQARDTYFEMYGKGPSHDLLVKSVANLGRMWVED
jgi:PKHD-type hydroxylase